MSSKIELFPGATLEPKTVLAKTLEDFDSEGWSEVIIIVQNPEGTVIRWSEQPNSALVYAHRIFGLEIDKTIQVPCDHD